MLFIGNVVIYTQEPAAPNILHTSSLCKRICPYLSMCSIRFSNDRALEILCLLIFFVRVIIFHRLNDN
jgi:hypothetical protein